MKRKKKNKFSKKEVVYPWNDIPATLKNRFYKTLGLGFIIILFSIVTICVIPGTSFRMVLIFIGLSLFCFGIATKFYYDLTRKGYTEIKGVVSHAKEVVSLSVKGIKSGGKRILYYHVDTDDGKKILLHAEKSQDELPIDGKIMIYSSCKPTFVELNGLTRITPIWGYDLLVSERE